MNLFLLWRRLIARWSNRCKHMQKKTQSNEQKGDLHRFGVKSDSSHEISCELKKITQNGRETIKKWCQCGAYPNLVSTKVVDCTQKRNGLAKFGGYMWQKQINCLTRRYEVILQCAIFVHTCECVYLALCVHFSDFDADQRFRNNYPSTH